jgi:hypothetical protein
MNDDAVRTERGTFADGDVTVERTVEYVERGVVVTLTAESDGSEPTAFALVETFPSGLPVSDAGFRPGTEPAGGRVDAEGARVEATVAPAEERTVVYALQFFEPAPEADLGEPELVVEDAHPAVGEAESVRARGGTAAAPATASGTARPEGDAGERPAIAAGRDGPEADPLGVETGRDPSPGDRSPAGPPGDGAPRGAAAGLPPGSDDREPVTTDGGGTATTDVEEPECPGGSEGATTDRGAVENAEQVEEAVETAERVRAAAGPAEGASDAGAAPATAGSERAVPDDGDWDVDGGVDRADGGVVPALLAELRDGSVSDRERAALRRELGAGHAGAGDVRIEHLESRMSEFAAYADALRSVIDEHGTAEAFVGRFEDRIDGLRADLDAVESELSATRETVEGVEDRLETLSADLDALDERVGADVESLGAELEALGEEVEERHGRNAEAVDRLGRRVDEVETFREELAAVFEDLDGGRG